ncbi:hypothetical protein ACVOMV_31870 [Mesorhizobium atlanticum]
MILTAEERPPEKADPKQDYEKRAREPPQVEDFPDACDKKHEPANEPKGVDLLIRNPQAA